MPVEHSREGNNNTQYKAQGDVVSAAKDTSSRGEREGTINGVEKVKACSAPTALPLLEPPKETEEPHVPGDREQTHDDNVSPHVKWFLSYTEVKRLKRTKRKSWKTLAARNKMQQMRAQDPASNYVKENPDSTERHTQLEISTVQPDLSNTSHGSTSAEVTLEITKSGPASVTRDTVLTSLPSTKEDVSATVATPTAPELPTSESPPQSDTPKKKNSGNTDDTQESVMDTTTGNRKRDEAEEMNSIRELLLIIQTHLTGENRPLSRDQVNLVNREIRSKNLRIPETTSVSDPPRISRRAQPKTTKDNTREGLKSQHVAGCSPVRSENSQQLNCLT